MTRREIRSQSSMHAPISFFSPKNDYAETAATPRVVIEHGNPIAKIVKDTKFWHSDKRIM